MFTLHVAVLAVWSCNILSDMCVKVYACAYLCIGVCGAVFGCVYMCVCVFPPCIFFISEVCPRGWTPARFFFFFSPLPSSISDKTIDAGEVFGYTQKQSKKRSILKPPLVSPTRSMRASRCEQCRNTNIFVSVESGWAAKKSSGVSPLNS